MEKKRIKVKDILNEALMSSGNPMDPVLGPSIGSKNPTYVYKVLQFNDELQGQKQKNRGGIEYINVGSYIEALDHHGEKIQGRIVKMDKDQDGYITRAYVLNEKNKRMTSVDIDSIKKIHFPDISKDMDSRVAQYLNLTKYIIAESVKHDGPVNFIHEGVDYVATLNEGRVLVAKLYEGKVVSAEDLLDESEEIDNAIIEKLNKKELLEKHGTK